MSEPALVVLKEFHNAVEAHMARDFLAARGIETFIFDQFTQNMALGPDSFYVRLMISSDDRDDALQALKEARNG